MTTVISVWRRHRLIIVIFAVAAALLVAVWRVVSRPSLESTGRRALDCLAAGDAACLYNLTTADERAAYALSPDKLDRLLKEYVLPTSRPVERSGVTFDGLANSASLICREEWLGKSGKRQGVGVFVAKTDEGIKCPYLVGGLLLATAVYERSEPTSGVKAMDKLLAWRDAAVRDKSKLEGLGVDGIYRSSDEGLIRWDDWIANCNSRIEGLRSKVSSK